MPYKLRELQQLVNPSNHKIRFDGYDYWWYSYVDGRWSLHCIKPFKSHFKALHYIRYWLVKYSQEMANNEVIFDNMIDNVMNDVRIYDIVNDTELKTIDKVVAILDIKPHLSQTEISEYLGCSRNAINKHFKKLAKKVSGL